MEPCNLDITVNHPWPASTIRQDGGRRQRGQGLTEFALVIPIFLLLVVALFDLGEPSSPITR